MATWIQLNNKESLKRIPFTATTGTYQCKSQIITLDIGILKDYTENGSTIKLKIDKSVNSYIVFANGQRSMYRSGRAPKQQGDNFQIDVVFKSTKPIDLLKNWPLYLEVFFKKGGDGNYYLLEEDLGARITKA